jgi:Flp pilus assembly protein TadD
MRRKEIVFIVSALSCLAIAGEGRAQSPFDTNYRTGLAQLQSGQSQLAVDSMNRALASLGGRPAPDPTIYNNLGFALMRSGRLDDAQRAFAKADGERARLSTLELRKLDNNKSQLARLRR